ncbi:transglycosylase SLT domain-containing protein [Desulforhabdus sp. TSK]|uniref:LysM peptidoglycan-binding domain-containing protein n=1 Tax=Desulforhabdus sp. TSK TaxID=2925014 RepID=UPI001FC850F7|nr:transglycosylase SLT domain-containing protein [Desulforhabdus sp. TSK]GKT08062.1 lytic transglycosylase [Desulforhabdus sp. TSK]
MMGTLCTADLSYWPLYLNRTILRTRGFDWLKFPLLSFAALLAVGCSTTSTQHTAPSSVAMQTQNKAQGNQVSGTDSASPKSELTIPDHPSIDAWTLTYSEKKHKSFQTLLQRAEEYVLPVQEIFAERGLPKDLAYVALVESGFTPTARSHANAVGMWQFISSTGKRFGLEQNRYVDERRHPFKSAQAAAEYLSVLYDQFGSWELALAAYNAGENGVQAALDRSGLSTFWELRQNGYLPAETRDYVPKFLASVRIIRDASRYGFYYEPRPYDPPHEIVCVPGGVKLAWLGEKIGVDEAVLRKKNPELCSSVTPPVNGYSLCVPRGKADAVLTALTEPQPSREMPEEIAFKAESSNLRYSDPEPPVKSPAVGDVNISRRDDDRKSSNAVQSVKVSAKSDISPARGDEDRKNTVSTPPITKTPATPVVGKLAVPAEPVKAKSRKEAPRKAVDVKLASVKQTAAKPVKVDKSERVAAIASKGSSRTDQKSQKVIFYPIRRGDTVESLSARFQVSVDSLCSTNKLSRAQKLTPGNTLIICTEEHGMGRSDRKRAD